MSDKYHSRLTVDECIHRQPHPDSACSTEQDPADWYVDSVSDDKDVSIVTQKRRLLAQKIDLGRSFSTDVVIWNYGNAPRRETTKSGGLPYWPKDREWPHETTDLPMTFVAQVCFADSTDLVGDLPGDLLLLFVGGQEDTMLMFPSSEHHVQFEWVTIDSSIELVSESDVPAQRVQLLETFGTLVRMHDFPDLWRQMEAAGIEDECDIYLSELEATKIGGVPFWVQDDASLPGRHICSISSVSGIMGQDRDAMRRIRQEEPDAMMFGDMGTLYVFLNGEDIHWDCQCG